jgi:acetyltransferase-like isoleucine patch superfamily enzyme
MRIPTWGGLRHRGPRQLRGWLFSMRATSCGRRLLVAGRPRLLRGAKDTHLIIGDDVSLLADVGFFLDRPGATVTLGDRTSINRRTEIVCQEAVTIGDDCRIGWDVVITDSHAHTIDGGRAIAPVLIADHVWIGARAIVLAGVTIGEGAVVGAGAVVTRDVAPNSLVVGAPARVVREDVSWEDVAAEDLEAETPRT